MRISAIRIRSSVTLLASALLLAAAVTQAVTVHGTTRGKQGDLKRFVSVSLDGPGHYAAITDEHGVFTIEQVTPGRYTVHVRQGDQVQEFDRDVGTGPLDLGVNW